MRNKIIQLGILFIVLFSNVVVAQKVERPKIVIGIVVDQMRWDYLYRYQNRFSNDGFNRLLSKGFNCQNTFLNYIPSYTAPGHASIFTGSVPALHGIVGNDWIENSRPYYCAEDKSVQSIGGSTSSGQMSPRAMKASTIGDELKLASNFRSKVFGIALKDRGAIFPAGHTANGAYWFDDSSGNFISSSFYALNLPTWLQTFNQQKWTDILLQNNWESLYPISSYSQSIADNNEYEHLKKGEVAPVFPHNIIANNYKQIRSLPAGNTLTFKLAKALINGEKLGESDATDMLTISLSSTDYIGHAYAPNSVEVEDMYLRLDSDIASFLRYLDSRFGKDNYLLFLSADHGGAHNAAYLSDNKIPAGTLSETELKTKLNEHLKMVFRQDSLLLSIMNYQVFLNEEKIELKNVDRLNVKQEVIKFCKKESAIAKAIDLEMLGTAAIPSVLKNNLINGYYPSRSGSIALIFQPAYYSDGKKGTTHGTWNPYDTHIPLLWYGWKIPAGETFKHTNVTDIAATLAALLHIQMPNVCIGEVIEMKED